MTISTWLSAFRLRTLPLALSCIGMGGFLAAYAGAFRLDVFLWCVSTTIFLQILSNLANDYGDTIHGADGEHRLGPMRTVQRGAISLRQMRVAVGVFIVLCLASGVTLLVVSFGTNWNAILFFLGLGLLSILAAIAYTVGRKPYGYMGLGDLSVLVFFGIVGVMGSYYLFTQQVSWREALPALSCGLFSIGVLNVNNIRDIDSDRLAGKFSIPVRIGKDNAARYHWLLMTMGIAAAVVYTVLEFRSLLQFVFLLSLPLFVSIGMAVSRKPSQELDPYLRRMAMATLVFVVLFGIGLVYA